MASAPRPKRERSRSTARGSAQTTTDEPRPTALSLSLLRANALTNQDDALVRLGRALQAALHLDHEVVHVHLGQVDRHFLFLFISRR
jgi:hypothetical protein